MVNNSSSFRNLAIPLLVIIILQVIAAVYILAPYQSSILRYLNEEESYFFPSTNTNDVLFSSLNLSNNNVIKNKTEVRMKYEHVSKEKSKNGKIVDGKRGIKARGRVDLFPNSIENRKGTSSSNKRTERREKNKSNLTKGSNNETLSRNKAKNADSNRKKKSTRQKEVGPKTTMTNNRSKNTSRDKRSTTAVEKENSNNRTIPTLGVTKEKTTQQILIKLTNQSTPTTFSSSSSLSNIYYYKNNITSASNNNQTAIALLEKSNNITKKKMKQVEIDPILSVAGNNMNDDDSISLDNEEDETIPLLYYHQSLVLSEADKDETDDTDEDEEAIERIIFDIEDFSDDTLVVLDENPKEKSYLNPETTCEFAFFDRKDNFTHDVNGWEKRVRRQNGRILLSEPNTAATKTEKNKRMKVSSLKKIQKQNHNLASTNRGKPPRGKGIGKKKPTKNKNKKPIEPYVPGTEDIYFIHVGKAGGTSIACNIKVARLRTFACVDYPLEHESMLSKKVTMRFHLRYPETNAHNYLITTRNPVQRLKSWFIFEHAMNFNLSHVSKNVIHRPCGQIMLFMCYENFHDFATFGLQYPPPSTFDLLLQQRHKYTVGVNITAEQCSEYAWGAVQGNIAATYHNYWNYERYTSGILQKENKTLYILRSEYLWKDWSKIDIMVGGTGQVPGSGNVTLNQSSKNGTLPVTNATTTDIGIRNLCRALCEEIQIYKELISLAANLSPQDREDTIKDLYDTCPDEINLERRTCAYYKD